VGPRAGLDRCEISRPPPSYDPRTVQPVASRYTDCAVPAHKQISLTCITGSFFHIRRNAVAACPNAHCADSGGSFLHQCSLFLIPSEHSVQPTFIFLIIQAPWYLSGFPAGIATFDLGPSEEIFPSQNVQTGCSAHPTSLPVHTGDVAGGALS
jgi:hypothetical protein